jgi:RES domain-containing protein
MTVKVWRIVKAKYSTTAFSGDGAKKCGSRWSSPGTAVVCVAGGASLAILEMLVHLESWELLKRYVIFEVNFDDALITKYDPSKLPRTWRKSPGPAKLQQIGDDWVASATSAVLSVPSAIVEWEWNYLLNPNHPDFANITHEPEQAFPFDRRLIKTPVP